MYSSEFNSTHRYYVTRDYNQRLLYSLHKSAISLSSASFFFVCVSSISVVSDHLNISRCLKYNGSGSSLDYNIVFVRVYLILHWCHPCIPFWSLFSNSLYMEALTRQTVVYSGINKKTMALFKYEPRSGQTQIQIK